MDPRLQRRIQRYGWDKAATHYEDGWQASLAAMQNQLLNWADARPGETVLDIACGTGLLTFPLAAKVGTNGRVIATDISSSMIDIISAEANALSIDNLHAFRADAESLAQVEDQTVDLVTCGLGLMYFPDPEKALQEMRRVLKPGGRLAVAVWGARRNCGWAEIFPIVDSRVKSAVCPMFFHLGTGSVLEHAIKETGFADVTTDRLSMTLTFPSDAAAVDAAFLGGPVALAYERFSDDVKAEANAAYLESISDFRSADGYEIPGEFVLARGRCIRN